MKKLIYSLILTLGFTFVSAQSQESVTFAGKILSLNEQSGIGCLFVDPEMVDAGVTAKLGNKTSGSKCISKKYGAGVAINFSGLNPDSDYPEIPEQDVLISVTGKWMKKGGTNEFQTSSWEPFF